MIQDMGIEETYEYLKEGIGLLFLFWFVRILLIILVVYGFCYLDNDCLNIDKRRIRRSYGLRKNIYRRGKNI